MIFLADLLINDGYQMSRGITCISLDRFKEVEESICSESDRYLHFKYMGRAMQLDDVYNGQSTHGERSISSSNE
jgi:hypothetical protein